jgi:hypothetical protein
MKFKHDKKYFNLGKTKNWAKDLFIYLKRDFFNSRAKNLENMADVFCLEE